MAKTATGLLIIHDGKRVNVYTQKDLDRKKRNSCRFMQLLKLFSLN